MPTKKCFGAFDHKRDGRLSFEEFRVWFEQQKLHVYHHSVGIPNGSSIVIPNRHVQSSTWSSSDHRAPMITPIEFMQKMSGLKGMSLDDVSTIFASTTGGGKRICNVYMTRDSRLLDYVKWWTEMFVV